MENYKQQALFIKYIYSYNFKKDSIKTDLKKLFPHKIENNMIAVDWYSGNLFVPKGDYIRLSQSPGFPVYESEWKLIFENGKLEKKIFKTDNYHKSIYTENPNNLTNFIVNHLDEKVRNKLYNKKFSVMVRTGSSKNNFTVSIRGLKDKDLEKNLIEILNTLSEFDYYYRHGEELKMIFAFRIIVNQPIETKE